MRNQDLGYLMMLNMRLQAGSFKIKSMSNRKERKPLPESPPKYSSYRAQGSPTKASVLLHEDHAEYMESLAVRRGNLEECLNLYLKSFENELPQRCLSHNDYIALYCQNEYKLLCVHCIFASARHKQHRVVPTRNSISNIARDNVDNIRVLEQELNKAKSVEAEVKNNRRVLQEQYKVITKQVDEEFKDIFEMINRKHQEVRQRVKDTFERAINMNTMGTKEVIWWRDLLTKTKSNLPKANGDEQAEIYKHLALSLFMDERLDEQKLTFLPSGQQIKSQFLLEVGDLKQAVEQRVGVVPKLDKSKKKMF